MADWEDCIEAARRKIRIAEYHQGALNVSLVPAADELMPPIAVQASFEGVIISVVAAMDQVAQAANYAWGIGASPGDLFAKASAAIEGKIPAFGSWLANPIGRDLRRLRTKIVHYSYVKESVAGREWHVQGTGIQYDGSRELVAYVDDVLAHGAELIRLADEVEQVMRSDVGAGS